MNSDPKTIAIIEDDPFLNKIYKKLLEKEGYEIKTFMGEESLFETIREAQPACVLLDLILPNKNGFEILTELKANPDTKDIPVIILSNLAQENDIKKGMAAGAKAYYVKADISSEELVQHIKESLA